MKIVWHDCFLIGDPTIDQEHRQLFELANELLAATDKPALTMCVMKLYRHVREHFDHEERLMREVGYPSYLAHREAHNQLITGLNSVSEMIARDQWSPQDLCVLIASWAENHIPKVDAALAEYVRSVP